MGWCKRKGAPTKRSVKVNTKEFKIFHFYSFVKQRAVLMHVVHEFGKTINSQPAASASFLHSDVICKNKKFTPPFSVLLRTSFETGDLATQKRPSRASVEKFRRLCNLQTFVLRLYFGRCSNKNRFGEYRSIKIKMNTFRSFWLGVWELNRFIFVGFDFGDKNSFSDKFKKR